MSESEILGGRVEYVDVGLPFTPELNESYDSTPMYRVIIDVSESASLGFFEQGYFIKLNYGVYFIRKKIISVFTNNETERLFQFLKKTGVEFIVDVYHGTTVSGHQHVQLTDIDINKGFYTLSDFKVFRSLWQTIEGELYENLYSPSVVRFTGERLIWYAKLLPRHSLSFTQVGKLRLNYIGAQGHLEVFRIEKEGDFVIPIYLFSERESMRFYNHEIQSKVDVIPLGSERRIVSTAKETLIKSEDHDPINLDVGQYLLFHPRPTQQVD